MANTSTWTRKLVLLAIKLANISSLTHSDKYCAQLFMPGYDIHLLDSKNITPKCFMIKMMIIIIINTINNNNNNKYY